MKKTLSELSSMELNRKIESTSDERSQAAKFLGRLGGKASVKKRFDGMSKVEISELMRKVRLSKSDNKIFDAIMDESVASLREVSK